jgi:hypothetical protein
MSELDKLAAMKAEYEERAKKDGKRIIKDTLMAFFAEFPDALAIRWTQYTPYFNDGDACIFGIGNFSIKVKGIAGDSEEEEDSEFLDDWQLEKKWNPVTESHEKRDIDNKLVKGFKKLYSDMQGVEEALQFAFGDHVKVTVTPDGKVEIDDYEHD